MRILIFLTCAAWLMVITGCEQRERHYSTDACINNLRQIDSVKMQWAIEEKKMTNELVTWDIVGQYMKTLPTCPSGGTYTLGRVGEKPICSVIRHRLP